MADLGKGVLQGKKTYVVAAMGILGFLASYLTGDIELATAAQGILTAILGITIRHGINTTTGN
jgi:hypothetical protein